MRKVIFGFFILLTGCATYCRPNLCMPCCYIEKPEDYLEDDFTSLSVWWEQFHIDQLNALIAEAICNNYDFRISLEKICKARGCYQKEFGKLLPFLGGFLSATRLRNSETLADSEFLGSTFVNFFQTGFDAFWELDLFGKNWSQKRAALFDFLGAREHARNVLITVLAEIAESYISLCAIEDVLKTSEKHIENERNLVIITEARYEAGLIDAVDELRAKALLEEKISTYHAFLLLKKAEIFRLAVLTGKTPEEVAHCFDNLPPLPIAESIIPLGLPSDLLCRRPDLRSAEYRLHAAGARLSSAEKALLPTVSLTASFTWLTGTIPLLFKPGSRSWLAGPAVSMPIFDGGILRGDIIIKNAKQRIAALNYENTFIHALKEVETSLTSYVEEMERIYSLREEVNANKKARDLAEILYVRGVADFKLVVDVERDLYDAEIKFIQSKKNAISSLIVLYKAVGGGWECIDLH